MTILDLQTITIRNFALKKGGSVTLPITYQVFGKPLGTAPIVMVNHALTGNSQVAGELGWWRDVIGDNRVINTENFTVLAFNIPGNGYDYFLIDDYKNFTCDDIAHLFLEALKELHIEELYCLIGGSLGGAIGWHMLVHQPNLAKHFIPVATDWKTTDWLHSVCLVQEDLLLNSSHPIEKARRHAMLCYRTPQSLNKRFENVIDQNKEVRKSQDWLDYHGNKLKERFSLKSYLLMNQILKTIEAMPACDSDCYNTLSNIEASIHLVAVNSDMLFPSFEILKTYEELKTQKQDIYYYEIDSLHGHDAFLMEYDQLIEFIKPVFS